MSSKEKSSAVAGGGAALVPNLRFPEFRDAGPWETAPGNELFQQVNNRDAPPGLPILAITQEHGAIPRHMIDYHVSVTEKSLETYKEVRPGDFIISLRSFQGGIEFSEYHGICSPAYVILRKHGRLSDAFYRQHFKSHIFIQQLTRNLEGLRDGKMISYKQFSELQLLKPTLPEQQKIADCLDSADALIEAQGRKVEALKAHKKGLMQQLFPRPERTEDGKKIPAETIPRLRFPEFESSEQWETKTIQEMIDDGCILGHLDGNHGELYPKADEFAPDKLGIPYISANDFLNGSVDFSRCKRLPIERARLFRKGVAKNGDILFAHNATVGPVAKLETSEEFVILSTTATYFRCKSARLSNDFLQFALSSPAFVAQYTPIMAQSTRNQVPITTQRKLRLQVPKLSEQRRIADCLTSLDDLVATEARKLDTLKTHKKGLMQQLFPQVGELDE